MSKYQKYFTEMLEQHKDLFAEFKILHDKYVADEAKWQKEFNEKGKKVVEVIRNYEIMLTSHQVGGRYGKYASGLADKFWEIVRKNFSKIDFVGVE